MPTRARTSSGARPDVEAVDRRLALGRLDQRGQQPHGRGLAGAVRPEQPEHLATADLEVHPADRPGRAESAAETGRPDHDGSGTLTRQVCPMPDGGAARLRQLTHDACLDDARTDRAGPAPDAQRAARRSARARRPLALPAARRIRGSRWPPTGAKPRSPACGRCRGPGTGPTTPTSRCPSTACRRRSRRVNPTGVYERDFEIPAAWSGRRVVLHVGAAESVLLVDLNGEEIGVGKDAHLASEFDLTDRLRRGLEHAPPDRGQVVRRDLHRGPGSVVARRHQPAGVPVRDRSRPPGRDQGDRRAGRRPRDGHARAHRRGRLRRRRAGAWLDDRGEPAATGASGDRRAAARRRPRLAHRPGREGPPPPPHRPAARCPTRERAEAWPALDRRLEPPLAGEVRLRLEVPSVAAWSAERPSALRPDRAAPIAGRGARRGSDAPDRLPAGRDRRARPADQRRAGPPAWRQPARLRPAHRSGRLARSRCGPTSSR